MMTNQHIVEHMLPEIDAWARRENVHRRYLGSLTDTVANSLIGGRRKSADNRRTTIDSI
jgi:hypothetical protein